MKQVVWIGQVKNSETPGFSEISENFFQVFWIRIFDFG